MSKKLLGKILLYPARWRDRRSRPRLSDAFEGLPPELFDLGVTSAGILKIRNVDTCTLVANYGTPLFVIDRARLQQAQRDFISAFRGKCGKFGIGISYKTNPVPELLRTLHSSASCYAEVISQFEFWLALKLGVPGSQIIFNGPGKDAEALRFAVRNEAKIINIDSLCEVKYLDHVTTDLRACQHVGVRVVTSVGWSHQFGIPISTGAAFRAFEKILATKYLRPIGLHLHLGTGIKDILTFSRAASEVIRFAGDLKRRLGITISIFDFGGGFGVPSVHTLTRLDHRLMANGYAPRLADPRRCPSLPEYANAVSEVLSEFATKIPVPEVIFEPGRAIISTAQMLLLKVKAVKTAVSGARCLIADGGKNIALPLSWESHQIFPATKMFEKPAERYDIHGPLCSPTDIVCRRKSLPRMEEGDILAVMDAGAYFISNQMNFSNPRPAIVMIDGDSHFMARRRENYEDMVRLDSLFSAPAANEFDQTFAHDIVAQ